MTRSEFDKIFIEKYNEHFQPNEIIDPLKNYLDDSKQNSESSLEDLVIEILTLYMSKNREFIYALLTSLLPISD